MLAFCLIAQLNRKFVQNNKTAKNSQTYTELLPWIEMIYIIEEINEKTLKNMFQSQ